MKHENKILELLEIKSENILTFKEIQKWLFESNDLFIKSNKPEICLSKFLPCFCFKRNSECLFIEIYKALADKNEIYKQNILFQNKLIDYEKIKSNLEKRKIWLTENIEIGLNELWFFISPNYPNIKMSFINGKQNDEFEYIRIQIDGKELKPIYDFANLFSKLFFEEKILPNEYAKWKYENEITD